MRSGAAGEAAGGSKAFGGGRLLRIGIPLMALAFLLNACGGDTRRTEVAARPPVIAPDGVLERASLPALVNSPELCTFALGQSSVDFTPLPDTEHARGCGLSHGGTFEPASMSFDSQVTASCGMVAGLSVWEREVLQPLAQRHFGQGVREVRHWGTYACRNRNSRQAGQRSEHARANAIDIHAFMLTDGSVISVRHDWQAADARGAFLRDLRDGSCDVFRGVLSPDADAAHRDHFHFDMGRWTFCR